MFAALSAANPSTRSGAESGLRTLPRQARQIPIVAGDRATVADFATRVGGPHRRSDRAPDPTAHMARQPDVAAPTPPHALRYALRKSHPLTASAIPIQRIPQKTVGMPVSWASMWASDGRCGRSITSLLMSRIA
jgi:hypothetical protein